MNDAAWKRHLWARRLHLCSGCKRVKSLDFFDLSPTGAPRSKCAECRRVAQRKSIADLSDSYVRQVLGSSDPVLMKLKRLQLQLHRVTR